ncbi:MAG: alpha/beta fold hydrolase [Gemmatimonadota bacterium]
MANAEDTAAGCRERDLDVRGIRVRLLSGGSGEPLLYLHGGGDLGQWTPALAALAGRYTVLRPDHPGFSASGDADGIDSVHELAFFYLDLLDELGLGRVMVVGHSLGGWLAADLATIEPGRVSKLVLVSAAGLRAGEHIPDIFLLSAMELADLTHHTQEGRAAGREWARQLADDPETHARYLRNRAALAHLGWNPYLHDPKLPRRLHRVTAPALVVWGARDGVFPVSCAHRWAGLLPAAELKIIPEAGHVPLEEQTGATVRAVLDFCGVS